MTKPTHQQPAETDISLPVQNNPIYAYWNNPPWYVQALISELLFALILGAGFLLVTERADQRRADREQELAVRQAVRAERLENLRFLRTAAGGSPDQKKFASLDVRDQDLGGLDLSGASFVSADLTGANLGGANLKEADLTDASLASAALPAADLSGATLLLADLSDADLPEVTAIAANFDGADLTNVDFFAANLQRANFRQQNPFSRPANLSGANLSSANLTAAELSGVCWSRETKWPTDLTPPRADCSLWD